MPSMVSTWCALLAGWLALLPGAALGQHRLDKTAWTLDAQLSEDFDVGTTLATLAPRWHTDLDAGPIGEKQSVQPFEPYVVHDNLYFANGFAYLNTYRYARPIYHANNRDYYYATAFLKSRADDFPAIHPAGDTAAGGLLYGMLEVRCKLPSGSGQYPSFWLSGDNAWPPEIDGFEFNSSHPTTFFSTVHWLNPAFREGGRAARDSSAGHTFRYARKRFLTKRFHTWTVVWTPVALTWFLDGKELATDTVATHIPGAVTATTNAYELAKYRKMDIILNSILNYPDPAVTSFTPFIIDYVHVYRPASLVPYQPGQAIGEYLAQLKDIYQRTPYKSRRGTGKRPPRS